MDDLMDVIITTQSLFRKILGLIIISNFILIFVLKLQIRLVNKFRAMFNLKDSKEESISKLKNVLFIISEAGDELKYFAPTLKKFLLSNLKIKILCLNETKEEEFNNLSKALHMEDNQILNLKTKEEISKKIKEYLNENKDIGTIITFDENGADYNTKHINIYNGLETYIKDNREEFKEKNIDLFILDTFSFLSQKSIFIPFIFVFFKDYAYFQWTFLFPMKYMKYYNAGLFKKIKLCFSGYTYNNSYTKVEIK